MQKTKGDIFHLAVGIIITLWNYRYHLTKKVWKQILANCISPTLGLSLVE
ncbi:hypothetical protein [Paenibacillus larvae]|nr:hypothetical protein [Paenibacillus larvae]